ncbi:MAG: globin domain-containing protein [Gemmatimonadales bacterium]
MTPESEALVRQSWPAVWGRGEALATRFYQRLFEMAPEQQRLFASTDMASQRRKFTAMLQEIVRRLGTPADLVPEVAALGARHVGYGVSKRDYGVVGEALLLALTDELGPAMTPELRQAWREAYVLMAKLMERGAGRGGI